MYWRPVKRVRQVQRPDGSTKTVTDWVARYPDAEGKRRSAGTYRRERDAAAAIKEAMDGVAKAEELAPMQRSATLDEFLPVWRVDYPRGPRTMVAYESRLRQVIDLPVDGKRLGDWNLRALRRRQVDQLYATLLSQGRAARGAKAILSMLRALHEDAIHADLADFNPWSVRVRAGDRRVLKRAAPRRVFSFDDLHEWASYGGKHEAMLRVGIDCGLRLGELLALEREHWKPGFILVRQTAWKGRIVQEALGDDGKPIKNHDRDVPLPPSAERLLMAMPVRLGCPWLFPSPWGYLWREEKFRDYAMKPTSTAASSDRSEPLNPTMREIRRSYVSNLRAAGIDIADLADMTGHSVETATRSYTEPIRDSYDKVRKAIG